MRKAFVTIAFGISALIGWSQQEQQYTQYNLNQFAINPAVAGTEDFIDLKLGYRLQWAGLESRPRTMYLSGHSTIGKEFGSGHGHHRGEHKGWHGVGGYIFDDKTGPLSRTGAYASYAYNLPITQDARLSLGVFAGFKQYRITSDWDAFHPEDDLLLSSELTRLIPDASVGAYYYTKYYYVSASVFNVLQSELAFPGKGNDLQVSNGKLFNHYFISGGFKMPLSYDFTLIPSAAIKAVYPSPMSFDVNAMLMWKDLAFGGVAARLRESMSVIAGLVVAKQWDVSYSYDLVVNDLAAFQTGSHEIIIGYRLKHPAHVDCPSRWWR